MRMKEDHMKNGQLKAGYNVQLATQHQFIVGFEIYQNPGDTRCFQPFMEKLLESIPKEKKLKYVIADAGYASEENYLYAIGEEKEPRFELLAPYQTYLKEQNRNITIVGAQPEDGAKIPGIRKLGNIDPSSKLDGTPIALPEGSTTSNKPPPIAPRPIKACNAPSPK